MKNTPLAGDGSDKVIRLTDKQSKHIMAQFKRFTDAICPPELASQPKTAFQHPVNDFIPVFYGWVRKTPRYHPLFNQKEGLIVDIDYIGFDFRVEGKGDPELLRKASQFIWAHRHETPNPALLKAWMDNKVGLDGSVKPGISVDIPTPIFANFAAWERFHIYIANQKKAGKNYIEIAESLLQQAKQGWALPAIVIANCERFLASVEHQPDMRNILAIDYVDFAYDSQSNADVRPPIDLKKSLKRKKISKRQIAKLEDIVVTLLPPSLRVGLTRPLTESQRHYLAKAAKWLRPNKDHIWQKPWTDGVDILALMVMDRKNPLEPEFIAQIASWLHAHIDETPDNARLRLETRNLPAKDLPKPIEKSPTQKADGNVSTDLMRRLILNPDVKHFPGSDTPKDLILTQMGILQPGAHNAINEIQLEKFLTLSEAFHTRRDNPDFWLMSHLNITVMLVKGMIDLEGNILAEELEVKPFLRNELRDGPPRRLFNDIAGLWLYPNQTKPLPETLTKTEAETLQTICHWLDPTPRRPRPFFWNLQDMVMTEIRDGQPLKRDRMRELAKYIHAHIDEPPNHDKLGDV